MEELRLSHPAFARESVAEPCDTDHFSKFTLSARVTAVSGRGVVSEASTGASGLPKLPELDKEDLKAVRSFLPGKVLSRTTALLALGVLFLGFCELLNVGIGQVFAFPLEPPWLRYTVLIGIPVLIVVAQILVEWQAERKRKQAQALAVKTEAVPEGYFRIGPYFDTPEDRAKFDRADRVHEKVLAWLKRADAVPLYLTGDSGAGKSSVLSAYALPELREAGWTVVEARAWQDPEAALAAAIARTASARKWKLGEARTLRGQLEAFAKRANEKVLLVLDQFEEFVILAGSERQKAFTALIDDLRAKPIVGLKLLLVLRSDYKTAIDELGLPLLRQGENWLEVGRFTIAAGAKFMARSGLALQPDALDRVATSASELDDSPGMIRPITLNVVGHVLSQGRASAPALDAGLLVRRYIEQSVEQPAIREIAPRVLKELVTEQGTKRPRSEKDLVEQTRLRPGEVRAVMNGLSAAALARPLDAAQGVWELSHDFVARGVARYLGRWRVDVPGLIRGYAVPALFVLMVIAAGAAGAIIWSADAADRLPAQLAELGIDVSQDEREAKTGSLFQNENWTAAGPLISRLTTLQSLNLSGSHIADLYPLKRLTALQTLDLRETQVANLAPLKGLTALQSLDLMETKVADIGPLKGLTALRELRLYGTHVVDLAPLKGLTALQWLDLSYTQVADLAPLKGLTALQSLNLDGTQVADLTPLKGLTALQSLNLTGTNVVDLAPLKGLTALQSLNLDDTKVVDLAPLKGLTALQSLNLEMTKVADLAPLEGLTALRQLRLYGNQVTDLAPLNGLTALQSLVLSYTQVADLAPLKGLTTLESLSLEGTKVVDLTPLEGLTALQSLFLGATKVVDLAPLQDLLNLRQIIGAPKAELEKLNVYRSQKGLPAIKAE
jgi:Leucine-rich repeat (LRR) protein